MGWSSPEAMAASTSPKLRLPGKSGPNIGDVLVADEGDAPDGDGLVLGHLELHDDFVVALRIDGEVDVGEEEALLRVEVDRRPLRSRAEGGEDDAGVGP